MASAVGNAIKVTSPSPQQRHTPLDIAAGSNSHKPYSRRQHRTTVITHGRKEQKNEGLYFDYEPVDAKAAKEVPLEKGAGLAQNIFCKNQRSTDRLCMHTQTHVHTHTHICMHSPTFQRC